MDRIDKSLDVAVRVLRDNPESTPFEIISNWPQQFRW